ncbi:MAG: DUF6273 domain-containing protein [Tannerella sp.]|jgi:hypothetical protein|nr:DUF6273 domain-containing protein [Tannerella sp.]
MKSNHSKTVSILCRLLPAVLALLLWPASEVCAQAGALNDGVNLRVNDHIYFGHYKHATEISAANNGFRVLAHEPDSTPVLWRVMGLEGSNGPLTLMSEYMLDTCTFTGTDWSSSSVRTWLNGTFTGSFTESEKDLIETSTVYTPAYDALTTSNIGVDPSGVSAAASSENIYLPWGTPPRNHANGNKMFWGLGNTTVTMSADSVHEKETGVKSLSYSNENANKDEVYYWLRTTQGNDEALVIDSDGKTNSKMKGLSMGVRPIFRLDTSKILFATEIKEENELNRLDQMKVEGYNYLDDEGLLKEKGTGRSVYKLTVLNTGINFTLPSLNFDLDETIVGDGSETVFVNPDDTVRIGVASTSGPNRFAYKIVDLGKNVVRYGDTTGTASAVDVAARNIYVDGDPDAGALGMNTYTAYLWAQNNHATRSHEGSTPKYFTLTVREDTQAPVLTAVSAVRGYTPHHGDTAKVTFNINELYDGKYYYLIDPAAEPTTAEELISAALTSTGSPVSPPISSLFSSGKQPFSGNGDRTITLCFDDNDAHTIYIAAKDQVRNVSNLLKINIPIYVPNTEPVAKDPVPTLYLAVGETLTVAATDIAYDPDVADNLTITTVVTLPDALIATENINAGKLEITGVAPGVTTVEVEVDDQTQIPPPPSAKVQITVEIAVRESTPEAGIDFLSEELTDLLPGKYVIDGDTVDVAPGASTTPIADSWFGATLSIRRIQPGVPSVSSAVQTLAIPARPEAPVVSVTSESFAGYSDGWITGVSPAMEYRPDTASVWMPVTDRYLENLAADVYLIRSRAVPDQQFVGVEVQVTVGKGVNWSGSPLQRVISLPEVTGVTVLPAPGLHAVASQSSFTFTLKFSGTPSRVRTSRFIDGVQEELTGVANDAGGYDYVIRNVQSPVAVYIDPATGLAAAEEERRIWAGGDRVYVKTEREDTAVIHSLSGQVVRQTEVPEGITSIPLPAGVYVVTLPASGVRRKVMIR